VLKLSAGQEAGAMWSSHWLTMVSYLSVLWPVSLAVHGQSAGRIHGCRVVDHFVVQRAVGVVRPARMVVVAGDARTSQVRGVRLEFTTCRLGKGACRGVFRCSNVLPSGRYRYLDSVHRGYGGLNLGVDVDVDIRDADGDDQRIADFF